MGGGGKASFYDRGGVVDWFGVRLESDGTGGKDVKPQWVGVALLGVGIHSPRLVTPYSKVPVHS